MPIARGTLTKASLTREPLVYARAWPAATPATAAALLPLLSENVREVPERTTPPEVWRGAYASAPALVGRRTQGDVVVQGTYDGLEHVWAMALGHQAFRYGGTVFPQQLATGVYTHRFEVSRRLHSHGWTAGECGARAGDALTAGQQILRRSTLVTDKQVAAWEGKSCMIGSLECEATPDGLVLALGLVGHSVDRDSATNPDLDALSDPDLEPVRFSDLELRLGVQSASTALDAGDAVQVSGLRWSLDNRLGAVQTVDSAPWIDEPSRVGKAAIAGTLFLPRYSAETLLDWAANGTTLMASLTWTGPEIGSTGFEYSLTMWLPHVVLGDAEAPVTGAERVQLAVPWTAHAPTVTCAGFPATSLSGGPFIVEVVSTLTTNPLR